jgi:hypothetical protein
MSFNLWNHKPWWCQPWSILLTGLGIITGSWLLFSNLIITGIILILVTIWWYYFLVLYPRLVEKIINEERRLG